jgi:hypothetical protein
MRPVFDCGSQPSFPWGRLVNKRLVLADSAFGLVSYLVNLTPMSGGSLAPFGFSTFLDQEHVHQRVVAGFAVKMPLKLSRY